mgnify:FL=1
MGTISTPWETPPAEGEATEIAKGVLWFRLPLPMVLDHVNCYALDEGDSWTLIDAGMNSRRSRGIMETLMAGPLDGKPISRVILTHHHPDHVGMAGWLKSEHGAEIWATRTAWLMARMLTLDVQDTYTKESMAFYKSTGFDEVMYNKRLVERPFNFSDVVAPIPLGFTGIHEGDTIKMGGRDWTVRLGNGHAPDHATFWSNDCNLVIGGDQLLATISPNIGVYATEPEADPLAGWLESCERLSLYATDQQLVLPGHKLPFTGLPTRMKQLIENHHGVLIRLLEYLGQSSTTAGCMPTIFKRNLSEGEYSLGIVEAQAHLNNLFKLGKVDRLMDGKGVYHWQRKNDE